LDHVGIAVRSLERSLHLYERGFGIKAAYIREVADQKTRVASLPLGSMRIELLEASAEDSPIARFITRRGEGIHHLCFLVDDILAELKRFKSEGMRLIDEIPRFGAAGCLIAFIHPSSTGGVLIELLQAENPTTTTRTR
jgi:methylmalonyl-CoA epimerase